MNKIPVLVPAQVRRDASSSNRNRIVQTGIWNPILGVPARCSPPLPLGCLSPTPAHRLHIHPGTSWQGSGSVSTTAAHRALAVWTQRRQSRCCHLDRLHKTPIHTSTTPPSSHLPRLFQSTKINSFSRTFDSIFPTEEEDAWRLLLKAALFGAQVAIYLLDDEKEKETLMNNSPLEQSVSLFRMRTTAGRSQEVLLKQRQCRNPYFLRLPDPADFQADWVADSPQTLPSPSYADEWPRPARQHKPWEQLQKPIGQRHFFWNKQRSSLPKLHLSTRAGGILQPLLKINVSYIYYAYPKKCSSALGDVTKDMTFNALS